MNVKSVEKNGNNATIVVEIDHDLMESGINKAYMKARKNITLPGFRKGKAPRKMIETMYGAHVFYEDGLEEIFPQVYDFAVKGQEDLKAIGRPSLTDMQIDDESKTVTLTLTTELYPEVTLGQYKDLEVEKPEAEVTEAQVQAELDRMAENVAATETVDGPAKDGDTANIDFLGTLNGVPFDGGKGENYDLKLGSGSFVPGFEEQLVGTKAGDEKDLDITFPENYHPGLAGKAVVFHVKVKEVKEPQAPVVDDEFAKDVSEFENLADFRKSLADRITERRTKQAEADFDNQIMEQLVENMECEIPDGMVDVQLDRMMENYAMELQSQGFSMEDYQKMMGVSGDVIRDSARPSALRQVQMQLALTAVADAENIEISDDELEAEVNRLAEQYKIKPEQVKAAVNDADLIRDLRLRKASDLVIAEAKVGKAKKKAAAKKTEKAEEAEGEEKPKRTRKKKTEEPEEPKAE